MLEQVEYKREKRKSSLGTEEHMVSLQVYF